MPADKIEKLSAILDRSKSNQPSISPKGFKEVVQTFAVETRASLDVAEFREYFDEIAEANLAAEIQKRGAGSGFTTMPFDPDYVEDETGAFMTHLAIIECVHGVKNPIIFGEPQSILARELCEPRNKDKWSVEKANTCAQFLEVVEHISRSEWIRMPPRLSFVGETSGATRLAEMRIPDVEKTMAILAFVRQIFAEHKQDGLFNAVCAVLSEHSGDSGKVAWINERLSSFANRLRSPVGFLHLGNRSCLEVLNMFLYGAGLMHAKPHSHHREDDKLAKAIEEFGRERVVAAFHFTMHSTMQIPFSTYRVVHKEFAHWLTNCAMAKPSRVRLATLFANFEPQPPD